MPRFQGLRPRRGSRQGLLTLLIQLEPVWRCVASYDCVVGAGLGGLPPSLGATDVDLFSELSDLGPVWEIMLFIGKPKGRSRMIANATNPLKESRKVSLLRCAGSTSTCVWLVCDLVVMCVQAVGDRALGDLSVCVRCGSVQSQKV